MEANKALKIALVGYGRMGRMIEQIALERGHTIVSIIRNGAPEEWAELERARPQVAIEFSLPSVAETNCRRCIALGIPVVSGTTGWAEGVARLRDEVRGAEGATFFWASNFSVGVHLFTQINRVVARIMRTAPSYLATMRETHHVHKLDAPSGTAISLAEAILEERPELSGWQSGGEPAGGVLPIDSIREGEVPGIHTVLYTSEVDTITLSHEAKGREGFALGAVLAAEYSACHSGVLTMNDLLPLSE